jgi:acetyl-CoA carboxylase / biotin carboxylase 1
MEMYADEDARGGVLEPEGIVNIKYRRDKQLETMARLDPTYAQLRSQLAEKNLSAEQTSELKLKLTEREKTLSPVYMQIALQFADLHDRAGRMEAKGTIRMPLKWQNARRFFYWRLRRRLSEEVLLKRLASTVANAATNVTSAANKESNIALLKSWTGLLDAEFDKDDRKVAEWYEGHRKDVYGKIDALKTEGVSQKVAELLMSNKEGGLKGIRDVLSLVPTSEREGLVKYLTGA